LVRVSAHFLWGHDAISFAIMTPPVSENTHPKKTFDVSLALVQFAACSVKVCKLTEARLKYTTC
jgi:hypothetical protein